MENNLGKLSTALINDSFRQTPPVIQNLDDKKSVLEINLKFTNKFAKLLIKLPFNEESGSESGISYDIYTQYKMSEAKWLNLWTNNNTATEYKYTRNHYYVDSDKQIFSEKVPAGVTLKLDLYGYSYLPDEIVIEPLDENQVKYIEIDLKTGSRTFTGTIIDINKIPIENAAVAILEKGKPIFHGNADENGRFTAFGLPDHNIEKIVIWSSGEYERKTLYDINPMEILTIVLAPAEWKNIKEYRFKGKCINKTGDAITNIFISTTKHFEKIKLRGNLSRSLFTDSTGAFEFTSDNEVISEMLFTDHSNRYKNKIYRNIKADAFLEVVFE
ncbi:MAG: carboxypeptidase regulatory-like domain-containing protein [Planctomycetes bacterium]|nr:carboxypeptidase regulatory-like domain-containing protein [Planctomycetota bacterium]